MTLEELLDLVRQSDADHWEIIGGGPTFLTAIGEMGSSTDGGWEERLYVVGAHHSRAAYRADISVGLAWGYQERDSEEYQPNWSDFPDRSTSLCFADFFYQGQLVYRIRYAVVDGGRAYLPAPRPTVGGSYAVTQLQHDLVRILHELEHGSHLVDEYDSYFDRAGFEIER